MMVDQDRPNKDGHGADGVLDAVEPSVPDLLQPGPIDNDLTASIDRALTRALEQGIEDDDLVRLDLPRPNRRIPSMLPTPRPQRSKLADAGAQPRRVRLDVGPALWSIRTLRGVWFSVRSPDHGADDADEEGWMEGAAVIAALSRKRAEVAGRREALMAELATLDGALAHLDGAMGLFTKGGGAPAGRRAVAPPRHLPGVRPGETARLALEVLRTAAAPMTAQDLARALCANREAVADEATVGRVSNALVMALRGYEKRGVVTEVGRTALRAVLWRVAGDQAV